MIWLSLSLFCNKNNWHILLAESVEPFVENFNGIAAYEITFNYLSGENIQLRMLAEDASAHSLAEAADEHFKAFFKNTELPISDHKLPVKALFMPFPVNSIQYGLYSLQQQTECYSSLSTALSQIIITALKNDIIDDDAILTLAFYLQVGLIKTIGNYRTGFMDILTKLAGSYDSDLRNANREKFAETRNILIEIATNILNDDADNPPWLKKWMMLCNKEMNKAPNIDPVNLHNELNPLVLKHLGVNSTMRLTLIEFILACFGELIY